MARKIALFVDIARQYHGVALINKADRINYERYLVAAVGDNDLHRAFAYGIQINDEASSFQMALSSIGYDVKYKSAKRVRNPYNSNEFVPTIRDTSWALGIALDVVRNIDFVDTVIIGSNDPELTPLVEWIKERGVRVHIFSFNIPKELRLVADKCIEIGDDIIERKNCEEVSEQK